MSITNTKIFFSIMFLFSLLFPSMILAAKSIEDAGSFLDKTVATTDLPAKNVQSTVGSFIEAALTMVGTIFFILMVYAGYIWMTARGEEERITKARDIIIAAIIGLALIVAAYAVTNFITSTAVKSARGG